MRGVSYLIDEAGQRTAVQIDLRLHGELWRDLSDVLLAKERRSEPRESIEEVRARLEAAGKLASNG